MLGSRLLDSSLDFVKRAGDTMRGALDMGANAISNAASVAVVAGGALSFAGRSKIQSAADGFVTLFNNAATDFTGLRLGGVTASFPMLKRSAATLVARLADDSANAALAAAGLVIDAAGALSFVGRSQLKSDADGAFTLTDSAGTGTVAQLKFGGSGASFPMIARYGTYHLACWKADSSDLCGMYASSLIATTSGWDAVLCANSAGAGVRVGNTGKIGFSDAVGGGTGTTDSYHQRAGVGIMLANSAHQYPKRTAPSAPAANNGIVFVRDNGGGKMQLCAIFPTGAIQVIATEP